MGVRTDILDYLERYGFLCFPDFPKEEYRLLSNEDLMRMVKVLAVDDEMHSSARKQGKELLKRMRALKRGIKHDRS